MALRDGRVTQEWHDTQLCRNEKEQDDQDVAIHKATQIMQLGVAWPFQRMLGVSFDVDTVQQCRVTRGHLYMRKSGLKGIQQNYKR